MKRATISARAVHCLLSAVLVLPPVAATGQEVDLGASVRQFEIVPCLLPARIRKLGNMTYPERRRLVETSALECELKGGEYTFYDRAAPESAAKFFKKLAEDGDVDAQVSLGDVYQYLYPEPDYQQAAQWYRTAMEAGSARAKMRLALLYERGHGVPEDRLMATNLWREATGAGEELVPASELEQVRTQADARIAELTDALRVRTEEAAEIRNELARAQRQIDERRTQLAAQESELREARREFENLSVTSAGGEELAALRTQVATQERRIEDQRYHIETLEADLGVQEAQLSASLRQAELQNERLGRELERVNAKSDSELQSALAEVELKNQQIARLQQQVQSAEARLAGTRSEYQAVSAELEAVRENTAGQASSASERIVALERTRAEQEARLQSQSDELQVLRAGLAQATAETGELKESLDTQIHATAEAEARFAAAEAELQRTQDQMAEVNAQLNAANRQLTVLSDERASLQQQVAAGRSGEGQAQQELQRLLATQDERVQAQRARIGELEAAVARYEGELQEISLRRASFVTRTPIEDTSGIRLPADVQVGRYYSLVIGNYDYEHLNDLDNAGNDARAVDHVLREEYGFDSKLLINATQKEIFRAFQELQAKTTDQDLVLIFYAGHGYEIKNESYWLPVEVVSRSDADISGISSLKVANWVRAMAARHVMIIADSCYSGSGIETSGGFRYSAQDLQEMLPYFMKSRSRTMLTSGGLAPVMDGDGSGGEYSIFTKELLGLLRENRGVLYGEALYDHLVERVKYTSDGTMVNQTPMFGSIESAGHECGQFVLLRPSLRT